MFGLNGERINGTLPGQTACRSFSGQQVALKNGAVVSLFDPATSRILKSRTFVIEFRSVLKLAVITP